MFGLLLRSEEHTSELQSRENIVCRLLLEKTNQHPPRSTLFPYTTLFRSPRIVKPTPLENINAGLLFSLMASLVNLVVGQILIRNGKSKKSLVLEADGRHLMTDVWTSVEIGRAHV